MERDMLKSMREGKKLSGREQAMLVLRLSFPAILAQLSTIIMEYIDASMVGSLGAGASASIGIVSSTTWLIGGLLGAIGTGFTVGIAHRIGAGEDEKARKYMKTGLLTVVFFALLMSFVCILIHKKLPVWMGGEESIIKNATDYFFVYALSLPVMIINYAGSGMLECSGNMKAPGILNIMMCFLDVVFNCFFIYPSRTIKLNPIFDYYFTLKIPGAGLGVKGAAVGTLLAELVAATAILLALLVFSGKLHLRRKEKGMLSLSETVSALKLSVPVMAGSMIMGFAYVLSTKIVSPLGSIAISANSFAITAESLCYMPGYGIAHAATTLVGQTKGAGRKELEKSFSWLSIGMGVLLMGDSAVLLYIFAPQMIGIMTPDPEIRELGTTILRIEAFAEPMFGASIVAEGVFRGLGKTSVPAALNLICMWLIRLPISFIVAGKYGLEAVWTVMCLELIIRGMLFIIALFKHFRRLNLTKK